MKRGIECTGKICDEYAKENQCISVIHRKNQGVGKARNNGVLASSGKYITFVDSDDYLPDDPTIYSKAISILENHDVDIVTWLWQFQNEEGKLTIDPHKIPTFFCGKKSMLEFAKGLYYGSYANGLVVGVCNKLYKRDYIKNIPFEGRIYEDDDWMSQVLAKTGKIFCEKKFWYIYVQNNTSLTHQKFQEQNLVMLDIVKRRMCLFKQDSFICRESMKLFLNLYIEFWFRAKESKIQPYHDSQTYIQFMRTLMRGNGLCLKDFIRYSIFYVSPNLYQILIFKMRKRKL